MTYWGRDLAERCARCGHAWDDHSWHVYTECLICGLDCRYYLPPKEAPVKQFAYDTRLQRPGCPLLQAAMGGDIRLPWRFPKEHWLLAPTDHLTLYEVTEEQIEELVALGPVEAEN